MNQITEIAIRTYVKDFLKTRIETINEIKIRDFEFNPFLIAAIKNQMNFKTPRDLANWLVNQRVERGTVTSFGVTLQKIAKEFSNEKPLPGFTMKLKKDGKIYNILITSGPNPYAKPKAIDAQNRLLSSKKVEPDSIPILGICYGNEEVLSTMVKTEMSEIKYYVGRDFWHFISGEKNCQEKIIKQIQEIGDSYQDKNGNSMKQILDLKVNQIEKELKGVFGDTPQEFWKNVLYDVYI